MRTQVLLEPAQQSGHLSRTDSLDRSSALSLDNIRQALIRQEETIIFSLIERAQFARNQPVYEPDAIPVPGFSLSGERHSLLEYLLRETEQIHGKIRRFTSPDEHAFYPADLPSLVLPQIKYNEVQRQINMYHCLRVQCSSIRQNACSSEADMFAPVGPAGLPYIFIQLAGSRCYHTRSVASISIICLAACARP